MRKISATKLLDGVTVTGVGAGQGPWDENLSFQAVGQTTSGSGGATVQVEGSLDETNYLVLGTITITFTTTPGSDGFAIDAPWKKIRGNVTAISGTGASVDLWMGGQGP